MKNYDSRFHLSIEHSLDRVVVEQKNAMTIGFLQYFTASHFS